MLASVLAFAAFAALITVTPGLDTMYVVRTAAVSGPGPAMAGAAGVGLGCLVWAAGSALGITALLAASSAGYAVMRAAGAAYLLFLGGRALWRHRRPGVELPEPPRRGAWAS